MSTNGFLKLFWNSYIFPYIWGNGCKYSGIIRSLKIGLFQLIFFLINSSFINLNNTAIIIFGLNSIFFLNISILDDKLSLNVWKDLLNFSLFILFDNLSSINSIIVIISI